MTVPPSQRPSDAPAVAMRIGSPVTLLPVDLRSGLLSGEVTHWAGGGAGIVTTIGVRTSTDVAAICAGQRVWLSGRDTVNELVVLEVIARLASTHVDTTLALTGSLPLAHEPRRSALRAATRHPATLSFDDGTTADGVVTDLSHSGCLIALNKADLLRRVGTTVRLLIELPANEHVSLACDVVRRTGATGEVALRFQPTNIEVASIDRLVYSTVKRNNAAEG
jgi:hypothetical protein